MFSHLKVVNSFTANYCVLLRINTYPSTKTNLASVEVCPQARHWARTCTNLDQALEEVQEDALTSAALRGPGEGGGVKLSGLLAGHVLALEMVALAAASSPPALSDSSESNLNATGRPQARQRGQQAVVSESHPSGEPELSTTNLAMSQLVSSI